MNNTKDILTQLRLLNRYADKILDELRKTRSALYYLGEIAENNDEDS